MARALTRQLNYREADPKGRDEAKRDFLEMNHPAKPWRSGDYFRPRTWFMARFTFPRRTTETDADVASVNALKTVAVYFSPNLPLRDNILLKFRAL